jgi:excisionase family DNA binding protein
MSAVREERLLKVPEVSEIFQVSPRTISNWMAAGVLKCVKIRHSVRFRESDVQRLLDAGWKKG